MLKDYKKTLIIILIMICMIIHGGNAFAAVANWETVINDPNISFTYNPEIHTVGDYIITKPQIFNGSKWNFAWLKFNLKTKAYSTMSLSNIYDFICEKGDGATIYVRYSTNLYSYNINTGQLTLLDSTFDFGYSVLNGKVVGDNLYYVSYSGTYNNYYPTLFKYNLNTGIKTQKIIGNRYTRDYYFSILGTLFNTQTNKIYIQVYDSNAKTQLFYSYNINTEEVTHDFSRANNYFSYNLIGQDSEYFYTVEENYNGSYNYLYRYNPIAKSFNLIRTSQIEQDFYLVSNGESCFLKYVTSTVSSGPGGDGSISIYSIFDIYNNFNLLCPDTEIIGGKYPNKLVAVPNQPYGTSLALYGAIDTPNITCTTSPGSWSNTAGRGEVSFSWNIPDYCDYVDLQIFDGNTYRTILSNTTQTSWNSSNAIYGNIYPDETILNGYSEDTISSDVFNHYGGGLALRDTPNNLYHKTIGNIYDDYNNYWFRVIGKRGSSSSDPGYAVPTLPNCTDTASPIGSISINNGSSYVNSTSVTISLNVTDPLITNYTAETIDDASGLSQMRFSNDGIIWSSWETYSTTKSWTIPVGSGSKMVYCQVRDNAGNVSNNMTDTIYLDTIAPTGILQINNNAAYTTLVLVTLNITGSDSDSQLNQMRFSLNGSTWSSWVPYSTTYSYLINSINGTKTVYMQLSDNAGNISENISDTIILDNVVPSGAVTINAGNSWTNNISAVLTLSYSDETSGLYQMQLSNSSSFSGASWVDVSTTANINLTAIDGTRTIYARFKDNAGNISGSFTDTIVLDRINPTGSITVKSLDGLSKTSDTDVVLTITGSDDRSGLAGMQLSNNGVNWGTLETLTSPKNWNVSVGAGTKTVYLKLIDNAGNEYVTSGDIYLIDDVIGPTITLLVNGGTTSTTNKLVTLNISAFDNFSKFNEMKMRFSNDGYLWSAWENLADTKANWDITSTSYGGTSTAGTKSIYVQVFDAAQNIGLGRADVGYSTQSPTGTVSVSTGVAGTFNGENVRFVANPNMSLTLSYSNVTEMRVSLDGVSYSPWLPYNSTLPITLPKGDGLTTVGVQVQNINKVVSDTTKYLLVLDTTPPNISVKSTNGATATTNGSVGLTILVTDNISTSGFQYQINGGSWAALPANGQITVSSLANGLRQIQVNVKDQAGNIAKETLKIWSL